MDIKNFLNSGRFHCNLGSGRVIIFIDSIMIAERNVHEEEKYF